MQSFANTNCEQLLIFVTSRFIINLEDKHLNILRNIFTFFNDQDLFFECRLGSRVHKIHTNRAYFSMYVNACNLFHKEIIWCRYKRSNVLGWRLIQIKADNSAAGWMKAFLSSSHSFPFLSSPLIEEISRNSRAYRRKPWRASVTKHLHYPARSTLTGSWVATDQENCTEWEYDKNSPDNANTQRHNYSLLLLI